MKYCIVETKTEYYRGQHPCYLYGIYDKISVMRCWIGIKKPLIFNTVESARKYIKDNKDKSGLNPCKWEIVDANDILLFLAEMKLKNASK